MTAPTIRPNDAPSSFARAVAGEAAGESLIVLSDVHLGSDLDDLHPGRARRARAVDEDLVRLLSHYRHAPAPDGRWRLVIAGDFIDFIGMALHPSGEGVSTPPNDDEREFGLGNAEDHARLKLRRVAARHADVFAALSAFVVAGHSVTFVHGNHDIELHWESVRATLREILREHAGAQTEVDFGTAVDFAPWFYFVDGIAWIEHGHQYDAYCATEHVMAPLSPLDPRRIARGFSEVLLRRVVRPTRGLAEHGHESLGIADYLAIGARLGLRGGFALVVRFVGAVVELFRLRRQHFADAAKALRAEHERRIALLAEATRIGVDRLRSLAALQVPPVTRSIHGILASVLLDRIALGLISATAMIACAAVAVRHGHAFWLLPATILASWAVLHRQLARLRQIDPAEVLAERAGHLARLFPVAFVVMGHTHVPVEVPVHGARYINVGAWAEEEGDGDRPLHRAPRTHLVIRRGEDGPVADLLAWDPEQASPRRFVRG